MDTTGLEGQTTMMSASSRASSTPGPGRALVGPLEPDAGHGHVVAEADEVLLEADLGPVHQLQPGAERVVGHRDDVDLHPPRTGQLAGDLAQGGPLARRWVR